jgi:hypothetical protein
MQATGTLREARFSNGFILVVVAMLCALLLGAAGGYRAGPGTAGGSVLHKAPVNALRAPNGGLGYYSGTWPENANQGSPQSDLTRVLPTAAPSADAAAGYDVSQWSGSNPAQPDHGLIP